MMFKNSFRLFCASFDKVWKYLLYQILCWGIIFALLVPFYQVFYSSLVEAWEAHNLAEYFVSGTFYGLNVATALTNIANAILIFVNILFLANPFACIYLMIMLFIVKPILSNIGKYTICEMVYGYMSASAKKSFTGTLLGTLNKSLPYACLKTLYALPFDAVLLLALYGITRIEATAFMYALPFVVVLIPALLLAFRETCLAGWAPAMIVFDKNVFSSFRKGKIVIFRRGLRVFSTAFAIFVLAVILFMVLGLYSLIILVPCLCPLFDIFEMIAFFSSQGMRFYVDADTIKVPKKLEEVDTIKKAKFLL